MTFEEIESELAGLRAQIADLRDADETRRQQLKPLLIGSVSLAILFAIFTMAIALLAAWSGRSSMSAAAIEPFIVATMPACLAFLFLGSSLRILTMRSRNSAP